MMLGAGCIKIRLSKSVHPEGDTKVYRNPSNTCLKIHVLDSVAKNHAQACARTPSL